MAVKLFLLLLLVVPFIRAVPSVAPNFTVTVINSTAVDVSWQVLTKEDARGAILGYYILYRRIADALWENKTVNGKDTTSFLVTSLEKFTIYEFAMQAFNSKGVSDLSTALGKRTAEDKPSGSPQDISLEAGSPKSILVTWNPVPFIDRNGVIKGYKIIYRDLTSGSSTTKNISATGENEQQIITLEELAEFTNYSIRILAFTSKGDGPLSAEKVAQTQDDKPNGAPQNVRGHNASSTSILVKWDEVLANKQNGIITSYTITYQSQTENDYGSIQAGPDDRQKELTNLEEYVNYNITVFASTVKGDGPASDPVIVVRTDQDKPNGTPQNVRGQSSSSASILVKWDEVQADKQNGIITGYTITYQSQTENDYGSVQAGPSDRQKELSNLKEYVNYNITVFASTVKGDGPASDRVIVVRTDQDKPDGAPQNVRGQNSSSTSILVKWDEVQADKQNAIITGYTITYQSQTDNDYGSVPAGPNDRQKELTNLGEYVNYNITVFASTVKGDGPPSDPVIVVRTDQHKPDGAPQNVRGQNSSSTSILVMWDEVQADKQNGIITSYTITYQSQTENDNGSVPAGPSDREKELTNLKEYVNYNITVFASTVKGDGPANDPVIVVRTDQDKPSKSPTITLLTVLSSGIIQVIWEPVPEGSRHGIVTKYTIRYKDLVRDQTNEMEVTASASKAFVKCLRLYTEYSFQVLAATVKGYSPPSEMKYATTGGLPPPPPSEGDIQKTQVAVAFVNKQTLVNGNPVSYFRMIVIPLQEGQDPGNSADKKYEIITRHFNERVDGEPYITAEFANDKSRTTFPVGDGKYYSRSGVTEARRKRKDISYTKYLNGKLDEGTRYAVFQRSFDEGGDFENEGFIKFTTKETKKTEDDGISTAIVVLSVVVGLLVLLFVVAGVIVRRRFHHYETKSSSRNPQHCSTQEILEMSPSVNPATSELACSNTSTEPGYYNTNLTRNKPATEGQITYEVVDGAGSGQSTNYDSVHQTSEDIYQEIGQGTHYQPLNANRQVTYVGYVKPASD